MPRTARLGVAIESGEAKRGAAEVNASLASMGTSAERAAQSITRANASINARMDERVRAMERSVRAAEEEIRAVQRQSAALVQLGRAHAAAMQEDERRTRQMGLAQSDAIEMDKRFAQAKEMSAGSTTKLRTALVSMTGPLTSMNSGLATSIGSLTSLAAGGGIALAVVGGLTLIGAAYTALTAKTREQEAATKDAIKALKDLAAADLPGGKLGAQAALAAAQLVKDRARLAAAGGGVDISDSSVTPESALYVKRLREVKAGTEGLAKAVADGERKVRDLYVEMHEKQSSDRTKALADLVAANKATAAETREAGERLRNLQADLSLKTAAGAPAGDRLRIIGDIEALKKAFDPNAAKNFAAGVKEQLAIAAQALNDFIGAQKVSQKQYDEQTAAAVRAVEAQIEADEKAAAAAEKHAAAIAFSVSQQLLQAEAITATVGEARQLEDRYVFLAKLAEGWGIWAALAGAAAARALKDAKILADGLDDLRAGKNPFDIPDLPEDKGTKGMAQDIRDATSAAQGLAQAFGESGRAIGNIIGQVGNLVAAISKIKSGGGGIGTALSIGGALVGIAAEFGLFRDRAKEAREAQQAYNRALDDFIIVTRTALEEQLRSNAARANALIGPGANFADADAIAAEASRLRIAAVLEERDVIRRAMLATANALEAFSVQVRANEEIIRAGIKAEEEATAATKAAAEAERKLAEERRLAQEEAHRIAEEVRRDTENARLANEARVSQNSLALRFLDATGGSKQADILRQQLKDQEEQNAATSEGHRLQIVYIQGLEAIARATAEAARVAEEAAAAARALAQQNADIDREFIAVYRILNPAEADRLETLRREADRAERLTAALDESTRKRLAELFVLEDQAIAEQKLIDLRNKEIAAAERLAGITSDVTEKFLRSEGKTFEADRHRLDQQLYKDIGEAMAAGASPEIIQMIKDTWSNNLNTLIKDQLGSGPTSATGLMPGNTNFTGFDYRNETIGGGASNVFDPTRDVVTRVAAGLTEITAVKWLDIGYTQISILRRIEQNTARAASPPSLDRTNAALGYQKDLDDLRAGG